MTDSEDRNDERQLELILRNTGRRPQPPEDLAREVRAAVHDAWRAELQRRPRSVRTRGWLAIAASVLLLVAVGIYRMTAPLQEPMPVAGAVRIVNNVDYSTAAGWRRVSPGMDLAPARLRTGPDSYASFTLATGTGLRVAEASRVELRTADEIVLETGAVYVDTSPAQATLSVVTPYGRARDIGTRFLVDVHPDGWLVQVRDGRVRMADDHIDVQARPGQRILISAENSIGHEAVPTDHPSWSWVEKVAPAIAIEGITLVDYLEWFAGETGSKVKFDDNRARRAAESTILHGSIDGLQPGESLAVVLSSTGLTYTRKNGEVMISRQ